MECICACVYTHIMSHYNKLEVDCGHRVGKPWHETVSSVRTENLSYSSLFVPLGLDIMSGQNRLS